MVLVVALAAVGIGSALWFKVLTIDGSVETGNVDAVLSLDLVEENDHGKDVADCGAELLDDNMALRVFIENGYPSYECYVTINVDNTGSIPVHIYQPVWNTLPEFDAITFDVVECYDDDFQLHGEDEPALCTLYFHVEQNAEQLASYEFDGFIAARQFNEPGTDLIIDADGTATPTAGLTSQEVAPGDALASFPVTGATTAGLDWFDNDANGFWTFGPGGDDLHSEATGVCPTAIRNGVHDLGLDCKILDIDSSLFDGQGVDCDLEVNSPFTEPHLSNGGCPSSLNNIRYFDADADGSWDDGEDIVLDVDGNGVFD
jgi:hypothetical protein